MSEKPTVDAIFCAAIELDSPEQRAEYLKKTCGDDTALRQEVERLLDAHFEGGPMLDTSAFELPTKLGEALAEQPGTRIGPYKLLQTIGEGGMGVVYMAQQSEPVERRVALKIIKPGMDSKEVIARFEAERQALALMDHQNIARVLDAGTTEDKRPYFVMELVQGIPITEYCDKNQLTLQQRLKLLIPVCLAIQHATKKESSTETSNRRTFW